MQKIKRKLKGFTLIELLAVIVVLAIILLVVIPIFFNVINETRKGAFEASTRGIIKAIENDCMIDLLNDEVSAKEISFSDYVASEEINYAGQGPKEGTIYVNEACEVAMAVHNQQWCVIKEYEDNDVTTIIYEGFCSLGEEAILIFGEDPASLDGVDFFDGTPEQGMIVFKTPGEYEITVVEEGEVEVLAVGGGGAGAGDVFEGAGIGGQGIVGQGFDGGMGIETFNSHYGGGGGGLRSDQSGNPGTGGLGGGGAGTKTSSKAEDGIFGGGGGGAGYHSTNTALLGGGGGDGIVIVRWGGYNKNYDPTDDSVTIP